jgi:transcriptional regulator with XRE-family HTH domain
MADVRRSFGCRLKELRVSRGLSQQKLGALASLDRSYLGGVERGERNVSLDNIAIIATALGVSVVALFTTALEERQERPLSGRRGPKSHGRRSKTHATA